MQSTPLSLSLSARAAPVVAQPALGDALQGANLAGAASVTSADTEGLDDLGDRGCRRLTAAPASNRWMRCYGSCPWRRRHSRVHSWHTRVLFRECSRHSPVHFQRNSCPVEG